MNRTYSGGPINSVRKSTPTNRTYFGPDPFRRMDSAPRRTVKPDMLSTRLDPTTRNSRGRAAVGRGFILRDRGRGSLTRPHLLNFSPYRETGHTPGARSILNFSPQRQSGHTSQARPILHISIQIQTGHTSARGERHRPQPIY